MTPQSLKVRYFLTSVVQPLSDPRSSGASVHLIRGGQPLDADTLQMHAASYAEHVANAAAAAPRLYVDNRCNVVKERVGKEIERRAAPEEKEGSVEDVLARMRADPFGGHAARDWRTARAAADVYAAEIAEYERRGRDRYRERKLAAAERLT